MNKTIPYPQITLTSFTENDFLYLKAVSCKVCSLDIKGTIIEHYQKMKTQRVVYPSGSKNFYVLPISEYATAVNEYQLMTPAYAAIWLLSAALHHEEIVKVLPENVPIVAWSGNDDSIFTNQKFLLAADLSFGEIEMRWMQIRSHVVELDPTYQMLMIEHEEY